jgi:hypothetical protein
MNPSNALKNGERRREYGNIIDEVNLFKVHWYTYMESPQ